jgi:hypothetical protein
MYGSSDINGMGGIRVENNTPHQQSKTMPEIRSTVKIRGYFKQKALALGKFNRVVLPKRLPPELKHGELVEIAVMGMLGRVSSFYDTFYGEPLNVTFNYLDDVYNKTDFFLNDVRIDITSRFTHDSRPPITVSARPEVKLVVLHYDLPGIVNLMTILDNVGILRPLPNQLIKDINYIWELYLTYNVMRKEEISYNHGMNEDLDDLLLYVADFPNLLNYSDYRQIAYMYVEDPNEQEHYQYTDAYDAPVSEEVPEPEPEPGPTEEELELQRKRADQINRLSNHLTQKGVNETNLFGKFKLDPYKSFAIDSEETFFSLLKDIS